MLEMLLNFCWSYRTGLMNRCPSYYCCSVTSSWFISIRRLFGACSKAAVGICRAYGYILFMSIAGSPGIDNGTPRFMFDGLYGIPLIFVLTLVPLFDTRLLAAILVFIRLRSYLMWYSSSPTGFINCWLWFPYPPSLSVWVLSFEPQCPK